MFNMHPIPLDNSTSNLRIGFIGAGRLATTLAMSWTHTGILVGVASRSVRSANALVARCRTSGIRVFDDPQALANACNMVFITVPDDAIGTVVEEIQWQSGQSVVHCSGATQIAILEPATRAGAAIGGFHPLQLFSNPDVALRHLSGSCVAIEASGKLDIELNRLAEISGMKPLRLPPGARVAYHIAGNLAASCILAVLREAEDIWEHCGLPREEALSALIPLSEGTIAAARQVGLEKALSGPVSRGDINVIRAHMDTIQSCTGDTRLYSELLKRLLTVALHAKRIDNTEAQQITDLIDTNRP